MVFAMTGTAMAATAHAGFSATTTKCENCHSVHGATGGKLYNKGTIGWTGLFTDADAVSCMYCHQDAIGSGAQAVYDSAAYTKSMHLVGYAGASPDSASLTYVGDPFTCVDCHDTMPHGAGYQGFDVTFALDPSSVTDDVTISTTAAAATTVSAWCGRCHEKNLASDNTTHKMYTAYQDATPSAYVLVNDCTGCHNATDFHLYNGGAAFTSDAVVEAFDFGTSGTDPWAVADITLYDSTSNWDTTTGAWVGTGGVMDGYCGMCHVQTGGAAGVGITF